MIARDQFFLKKMYENQTELASGVRKYNITSHSDLSNADPIIRRGLIHSVADIFELMTPLSDKVKNKLPLNKDIIKQFRNAVTHAYGTVTNPVAYACIKHCIDKDLMKIIKDLSNETT